MKLSVRLLLNIFFISLVGSMSPHVALQDSDIMVVVQEAGKEEEFNALLALLRDVYEHGNEQTDHQLQKKEQLIALFNQYRTADPQSKYEQQVTALIRSVLRGRDVPARLFEQKKGISTGAKIVTGITVSAVVVGSFFLVYALMNN